MKITIDAEPKELAEFIAELRDKPKVVNLTMPSSCSEDELKGWICEVNRSLDKL